MAVKLSPYFSALGSVAAVGDAGGRERPGAVQSLLPTRHRPGDADDLPDDGADTGADLRLPLRWVGILRDSVEGRWGLSGGVHSPESVVKGILAGADVVMTTAALLRHGPEFIGVLRDGMARWF